MKTIRAKFKGTTTWLTTNKEQTEPDYIAGQHYTLEVATNPSNHHIVINTKGKSELCEYSSLESFLSNWTDIEDDKSQFVLTQECTESEIEEAQQYWTNKIGQWLYNTMAATNKYQMIDAYWELKRSIN